MSAECRVHSRYLVERIASDMPRLPQELHDIDIIIQRLSEIPQMLIGFGTVISEACISWIGRDKVFSHRKSRREIIHLL